MAENPTAGVVQEEEEDNLEYDSDGNPIAPSKKIIDPLPPIDHSEVGNLLYSILSKGLQLGSGLKYASFPMKQCCNISLLCHLGHTEDP